jgi:cell wall-associated NlpC family hydrolase
MLDACAACVAQSEEVHDISPVADFYSKYGIALEEAKNLALYEEAFKWIHTKYKYGAKTEKAIDCSGFAGIIFEKVLGKTLPHSTRSIFPLCQPLNSLSELQEGDLLFFKIWKGVVSHVAIYLQNGKFIHAAVHGGVRIDSLEQPYYKKYFYKAARLREE